MELSNPGKSYQVSGNIVHCCQYHVLFCSKWRRKVLTAPIAEHLRALIDEKQGEFGYRLLGVDISVDHVHLLVEIPPEKSVCAVVGRSRRTPRTSCAETTRSFARAFPRFGRA